MKKFSISLVLICTLSMPACIYEPATLATIEAELRSLTVFPTYWCSGQTAQFRFDGFLVDSVNVYKSDNTMLLRMISPYPEDDRPASWSGSGITPPMRREWAPLSVKFISEWSDAEETYPFPPEKFVNIDTEEWTRTYAETTELGSEPEFDHVANSQEYDSESGELINVPIYDVYREFVGFSWRIPFEHSSRATLMKIHNLGDRTMTFRIVGVEEQFVLSPDQVSAEISALKHPAGTIEARYEPVERRKVGIQKGEYTKPENEHYSYQNLYVEQEYPIRVLVRCRDT